MTARDYIERAIAYRGEGKDIVHALGVSQTDTKNDPWWLAIKTFVMHLPDTEPQLLSDFTDEQVDSALASALKDLSK